MTEVLHTQETRTIKHFKIVLKGDKWLERAIEGVNLIKVHYIHVWKYHNESSWYN
jgi:hypothetical protein